MNKSRLFVSLILSTMMVWSLSCTPENSNSGKSSVVKAVLSFSNYKSEKGFSSSVSLQEGVKAVMVNVKSGETVQQEPLSGGGSVGTFLFNVNNTAEKDQLFLYYPSSANPAISGSKAVFNIPSAQSGGAVSPIYVGSSVNSGSSYTGTNVSMSPLHTMIIGTVRSGAYSISEAVLTTNGGEGIAGDVTIDMSAGKIESASEFQVRVKLSSPLDCREQNVDIPFEVAPVVLSKGFSIKYTTTDGATMEYVEDSKVSLDNKEVYRTDPATSGRMLIACGSNKVYIFDALAAKASRNYKDGLIWEWDAKTVAANVGLAASRMDHIDDAKPVNDNKQLLITSSYGWAALVEIETKKLLWYATNVINAHSAEILPGNLIAVACAEGYVALFDASAPNKKLAQYDLASAHGVVWVESVQRLYAIGTTSLQKYRIVNSSLSLDFTYDTKGYVTGLHDMTKFDTSTLVMAGSKAASFNVNTEKFTPISHFSGFVGMKSINCNSDTGEVYYTFGTEGLSEGSYTWSSHWIRYSDNMNAVASGAQNLAIDGHIRVEDINMYKVRVFSW